MGTAVNTVTRSGTNRITVIPARALLIPLPPAARKPGSVGPGTEGSQSFNHCRLMRIAS